MIKLDEAVKMMRDVGQQYRSNAIESIAIEQSDGRILAKPIAATTDQPIFSYSSVDGFAFNYQKAVANHFKLPLQDSQAIFAGDNNAVIIDPNRVCRIATGAKIPQEIDTVAMQEHCNRLQNLVTLPNIAKGSNVIVRASQFRQGQQILTSKAQLNSQAIALLASQGYQNVAVFSKLQVSVVTSGSEVTSQFPLKQGQVFNSNRVLLQQLLQKVLFVKPAYTHIVDDYEQTKNALLNQTRPTKLVISCGGVSVGSRDFIGQIMRDNAEVYFWRVAVKPGKPILFGRIGDTLYLCLPGNIGSVFVGFYLFVRPLLHILANSDFNSRLHKVTIADCDHFCQSNREQLVMCQYTDNARQSVAVLPHQLSGAIGTIGNAQCLIPVAPNTHLLEQTHWLALPTE